MTSSSMPSLRILVADDIAVNLRVVALLLKGMGHSGVLVPDGQQALDALAQQSFDLVLLDVSMPVLDGLSTLRGIRELERQGRPHVPVIMVTGHVLPEDRARYLEAGADGFVPKPIQREALDGELRRVLGR